jgi:hypothetical protein
VITVAVAVAVAVAVVVTALVRLSGGSGDRSADEGPADTRAATTARAGAQASDGRPAPPAARPCPPAAADETVPTAAPAGTRWEMIGGVAAPGRPDVGPAVTEPVRGCFARSPTGALLAAANLTALTTLPQAEANEAILRLTADTPGRELFTAAIAAEPPRPAGDTALELAGFSLLSWTRDEGVVDLALLVSEPGAVARHVSVLMTLRWEDGDWRVVASDTSGEPFTVRALPSLTGYVPWSPA